MKKLLLLLLFPLFASSQIDYYRIDTLSENHFFYFGVYSLTNDSVSYKIISEDVSNRYLYKIDTIIDTIPVIITFIDYNYALNLVKYILGYEVQLTIIDNYPVSLSMLATHVNSSNNYLNVTNEVVQYLDIDKKRLPENYKVLQTYKR